MIQAFAQAESDATDEVQDAVSEALGRFLASAGPDAVCVVSSLLSLVFSCCGLFYERAVTELCVRPLSLSSLSPFLCLCVFSSHSLCAGDIRSACGVCAASKHGLRRSRGLRIHLSRHGVLHQ